MFRNDELVDIMSGLHKFAWKLTSNKADADDLLQATILRAIEKKHLFREGSNLFSWCNKIMYNLFVSDYRRKVKFTSQYDPEPYIKKQKTVPRQENLITLKEVKEAMEELPEEQAEIIDLVCLQGRKYKTAARKLGVPVGTVRSRVFRARGELRDALGVESLGDSNIEWNAGRRKTAPRPAA